MRFLDADGPSRGIAVLKHEKITEEWLRTLEIGAFTESCPEVKGAAHCLLSPVIEVVAERGTDLRLGLYRGDQCLFFDNKEVPFLGRPEETGKFNGLLSENVPLVYLGLRDEFRKKINETVHVRAASYCAAETLVCLAALLLFSPLSGPSSPVMSYSPLCSFRQLIKDSILSHNVRSIEDSLLFSKDQLLINCFPHNIPSSSPVKGPLPLRHSSRTNFPLSLPKGAQGGFLEFVANLRTTSF
jgi:hypothetical protein